MDKWDLYMKKQLGYPCNFAYDYGDVIKYLKYNLNNVGDPFTGTNYSLNTMDIEKDVLHFFSKLWNVQKEHWGYVTFSGTEGNMEGLLIGRERFPNGILYTSDQSHYSIFKIVKLFKMDVIIVPTTPNGEMDYIEFEKIIDKSRPAIINANIGTTMKGAVDDVDNIVEILKKNKIDYHLHADGALMGFVLPFLYNDLSFSRYIHSISISGHKFLGVPFPCGIFMVEKKFKEYIVQKVEYIGSLDATIMGSRNGHAPLFLHNCINKKGMDGFREDIYQCLYRAQWFSNLMKSKGVNAWINHYSITVIFPRPSDELIKKWALATENEISHVIVMPHVTKKLLHEFLDEYLNDIHKENSNTNVIENVSSNNNEFIDTDIGNNETLFQSDESKLSLYNSLYKNFVSSFAFTSGISCFIFFGLRLLKK